MKLIKQTITGASFPLLLITFMFYQHAQTEKYKKAGQFIQKHCPSISKAAIKTSLLAFRYATASGLDDKRILTIVDYTLPSNKKRLCSIDIDNKKTLFKALVAHGVKSGGRYAKKFSNKNGSHESSLGLYVTGSDYYGAGGRSLRLYGLDVGINDHAAKRHIVLHGSKHVNIAVAKRKKQIGHTLGCFAVSKSKINKMIRVLQHGTLLFAYYPKKSLLSKPVYLHELSYNNIFI